MSIVVELTSLDELAGIDDAWHALLRRMPRASFFQSLSWLRTYWQHFGGEQALKVMLVGDRNTIHGIIPLCVRSIETATGPLRVLSFAGSERHQWGGPVGPHPVMTMSAVLKHLRRRVADWDMVSLQVTDWDNDRLKSLRAPCQVSGWRFTMKPSFSIATAHMAGSTSSASRMKTLLGPTRPNPGAHIEYSRFRPSVESESTETGWEMVEACNAVIRQNGTLAEDADSRERRFFEDVHVDAVRLGLADVGVLKRNGVPVAFHYGYAWDNHIDELLSDYNIDPSIHDTLMRHMLNDSESRGDRSYRFVDIANRRVLRRAERSMTYTLEVASSTFRKLRQSPTARRRQRTRDAK